MRPTWSPSSARSPIKTPPCATCTASYGRADGLSSGSCSATPHMVTATALRRRAEAAGLRFERRVGPAFGYFGALRRES
jgi:hypothetical protein